MEARISQCVAECKRIIADIETLAEEVYPLYSPDVNIGRSGGSLRFAELRRVGNDTTLVEVVDDGIDSALRSSMEAVRQLDENEPQRFK